MTTVGRPPNIEIKNKIAITAFNLFSTKGYNKTTYQDIADAIRKDRTLIQHFFSKKETFIVDYLNKLMIATEKYIMNNSLAAKDDFATLFIIGQIYFSFLLMNDGMKTFTFDIISDRKNTVNSLLFNVDWVFSFLNVNEETKREMSDEFIMTMGGAYELIYKSILNDENIYLPQFLKRIIINFTNGLNYKSEEVTKTLSEYILDVDVINKATEWLALELLGSCEYAVPQK